MIKITKISKRKNPYRETKTIEYQYGYLQGLLFYLTQFKYSKKPNDLIKKVIDNSKNFNDDWLDGHNEGSLDAIKFYKENGLKKTLTYAKEISEKLIQFRKDHNFS